MGFMYVWRLGESSSWTILAYVSTISRLADANSFSSSFKWRSSSDATVRRLQRMPRHHWWIISALKWSRWPAVLLIFVHEPFLSVSYPGWLSVLDSIIVWSKHHSGHWCHMITAVPSDYSCILIALPLRKLCIQPIMIDFPWLSTGCLSILVFYRKGI